MRRRSVRRAKIEVKIFRSFIALPSASLPPTHRCARRAIRFSRRHDLLKEPLEKQNTHGIENIRSQAPICPVLKVQPWRFVQIICEISGGYDQASLDVRPRSLWPSACAADSRVSARTRGRYRVEHRQRPTAVCWSGFGKAIQPELTSPRSAADKLLREWESQRRHLDDLLLAEQARRGASQRRKIARLTTCSCEC